MIIVSELSGQLGNRLLLNAYGMTLSEATGQKLVDLSLHEYRFLFPATRRKLPLWVYTIQRKLVRVLIKGLRKLPFMRSSFVKIGALVTDDYSVNNPEFVAGIKSRMFTFIEGFPEPCKVVLLSTDPVRAKFTPDAAVLDMVRNHIAKARTGVDVLVGLHIRRGDYDHFFGGKYNYPASFYLEVMEAMTSFFPGKKVAFLLCTNGSNEFDASVPYKIIPGPGMKHGALGDLHCLAECDYIIGAPSTFSLWAAFYGKKPIIHLIARKLPASLDEFQVADHTFEFADLKHTLEETRRLSEGEEEYYRKHKRKMTLYENFNTPRKSKS